MIGCLDLWAIVPELILAGLALLSFLFMDVPITITMVIATIAGVGLSMLVGTGLMGLIFLSANSGRDDEAANHHVNHDDWVPPDGR